MYVGGGAALGFLSTSLRAGRRSFAARTEDPIPGMTDIAGYLTLYCDRMDGWSEEGLPSG